MAPRHKQRRSTNGVKTTDTEPKGTQISPRYGHNVGPAVSMPRKGSANLAYVWKKISKNLFPPIFLKSPRKNKAQTSQRFDEGRDHPHIEPGQLSVCLISPTDGFQNPHALIR